MKTPAHKNGQSQERERQKLIRELEKMLAQPGSEMGKKMIALRIEALKGGQRLLSIDDVLRITGHDHVEVDTTMPKSKKAKKVTVRKIKAGEKPMRLLKLIGLNQPKERGVVRFKPVKKSDRVIWRDPERMSGEPCFTGTRVPVKSLLEHLASGYSLDEFLDNFPTVKRAQAKKLLERLNEIVVKAEI